MIIENLVLVLGFILLGTIMKRSGHFPENSTSVLNTLVIYVSLPAIIILSISKLEINTQMLIPVVAHWFTIGIHILILLALYKWLKFSKSVLGALIVVTTMGNTAFLGIPLIEGFFGHGAVPYAVLYDQLGSGIAFIIMGAFVLPYFTGQKSKTLKEALVHLFTFPPFLALIAGFMFKIVPMPFVVENVFVKLSATLIPCAMLGVGFDMKYKFDKASLKPLVIGLWVKLLIIPLIVLATVKFIGLDGVSTQISVIQSGMPPMITAGALAINSNLEKGLATSLVGYGLIFSFITLSFLRIIV